MDIFNKCRTSDGNFGKFRESGDQYFTRPTLDPLAGNKMKFQDKECIMWSVNNYLGLAGNEDIKQKALDAVKKYSVSSPMGSRMMSGTTHYHLELEKQLAELAQKESSILFNYGYLGVLGTIASLVKKDDIILMDKLCHASIVDAALLSSGQLRVFKHNNMDSLEKMLKRVNRDRKGGVLILTEGVYGMTGDIANLKEICALKEKYNARLFIDDAHGFGVMGNMGRGTADYCGVQDKVDIYFGTFAKSCASIGGFSASSKEVVEWILYNARTQVFAKSLPMVYVESLKQTLEIVKSGEQERIKLFENAKKLKDGLRNQGYYIADVESPICPVYVPGGDIELGCKMMKYIRDRGVFITGVSYPVIPIGLFLFRMIPTASHTDEDIEKTVNEFKNMRHDLNLNLEMDEKDIRKIYGI